MKKTAILLSIVLAFAVTVQAQSLADFARQERERRKNIETKIVITNATLNGGKGPSPIIPSPTTEPAAEPKSGAAAQTPSIPAAGSTPATGPTDRQGRDEKSWRAAFVKVRDELKRAEDQVKATELKLNQLNLDYLQRSDVYNKEQRVAAEINAANAQLTLARKDVEQARLKISQMEEELRRAGGPAGWAR